MGNLKKCTQTDVHLSESINESIFNEGEICELGHSECCTVNVCRKTYLKNALFNLGSKVY